MKAKNVWIYTSLVILVVFIGINLFSTNEIESISTAELKGKLEQNDALFIDVREHHEFEAGHIEGLLNFPLSKLEDEYKEIPKSTEVVIICHSGNRSMQAAKFFQEKGYENIINVEGGMLAWQGEVVQ